ncbi:phytyl ester synthase 1, chloroplastic-like isoform X2 [Euphorbia lathyris]|uniref:phytyl ester synthase 1, chloroplastic-like isoform X2 n=1 Tax=Euphorbia lathyris TaxID=212925 RepID=UPI003314458C
MASAVAFMVSPYTFTYSKIKLQFQVRVQSFGGRDVMRLSNSIREYGTSLSGLKEKNRMLIIRATSEQDEDKVLVDGGNRRAKSRLEKKWVKDAISEDLEVLWDDGYGTKSVKDYLVGAREIITPDGGPPRWFCPVECGQPLKNSPVLLYLPGLDGVGLGLTLHHKSLGKLFEVRCLHVPIHDRTPFEGLVKLVEEAVRLQHASFPDKPIYLVGESFGGCLALTVAARNPKIDFVVILVNPGTSLDRSQLMFLVPVLEVLPEGLCDAVPYLLSSIMGNPLKMAMADIDIKLPPRLQIQQLLANLIGFPTYIPDMINSIPSGTFLWKFKLLKSAAADANSHLHAVKAEVLVLASGNDNILPSRCEGERLQSSLQNCSVRHFKDNGHLLLLEEGVNLLTIIKVSGKYRRSRRHDFVSDFVPPSTSELRDFFERLDRSFRIASSSAMFSTMADGRIVRGLAGVPDEGPLILVGNHMLMGMEVFSLVEEFVRKKNFLIHGIAHPAMFSGRSEDSADAMSLGDWFQVLGAIPVSPVNLFKLLSAKKHVLLYPGGARESLHYKGEEYKLIWPDEPEFVRMAARFGATIVPFSSVGEDDILHMGLDYHDLMKIPMVNDYIRDASYKAIRVRDDSQGTVATKELCVPWFLPKIPGRFYVLFGKPIETKGKEALLKDKDCANEMYLQVKSEIRSNLDYLLNERNRDPYRSIVDRTLYCALSSPLSGIPAFDP